MERTRLVFSGSGGQGLVTAAIILAEAAIVHDGLNAVQTQSYGPAARGGATRADVIISNARINYPMVVQPNILVCLTQEAYNRYAATIRPGGLLMTDTRYVKIERKVDAQQRELPIYQTIMEKIGNPAVFNIAVLGALLGLRPLVSSASVMAAMGKRLPPAMSDINRQALQTGLAMTGTQQG
ncbi:MAG: 2-oxoacid:ferredoxin oxidoreductase subunit gamma [Desulfatitalea sp.]|nr:2-oxoacid:acceptor oxidoreductase family protein [Desulfatitalea sp.]NNK02352.1 2-oxoacid:ferredoxin oxidoreductase subunit gamma [Desulfatitalea sp.]